MPGQKDSSAKEGLRGNVKQTDVVPESVSPLSSSLLLSHTNTNTDTHTLSLSLSLRPLWYVELTLFSSKQNRQTHTNNTWPTYFVFHLAV